MFVIWSRLLYIVSDNHILLKQLSHDIDSPDSKNGPGVTLISEVWDLLFGSPEAQSCGGILSHACSCAFLTVMWEYPLGGSISSPESKMIPSHQNSLEPLLVFLLIKGAYWPSQEPQWRCKGHMAMNQRCRALHIVLILLDKSEGPTWSMHKKQ